MKLIFSKEYTKKLTLSVQMDITRCSPENAAHFSKKKTTEQTPKAKLQRKSKINNRKILIGSLSTRIQKSSVENVTFLHNGTETRPFFNTWCWRIMLRSTNSIIHYLNKKLFCIKKYLRMFVSQFSNVFNSFFNLYVLNHS